MSTVKFKRIENSSNIGDIDIEDGSFIVTKDGAFYIDYNESRISINVTGDAMLDRIYPVGSYYETSDSEFNPNTGFVGEWVLDNDGTVLVSKRDTTGSIFNTTIGSVVGEEKHTQTVSEMPQHNHRLAISGGSDVSAGFSYVQTGGGWNYNFTESAGAGTPFNVVQPSKIVYRWHRIA